MGKLEDMRVERVDGVDRPATGHRWVIVKSEEAAETVEKDYAGAARAALDALAKEEDIAVSKETAEALTALAALLEMSVEFKSVEGAPASGDPGETIADDEPLTKSTLKDALLEVFASEDESEETDDEETDDDEVEKTEPTSRQPQEQDEPGEIGTPLRRGRVRKSGRPSFSNIVLGQ